MDELTLASLIDLREPNVVKKLVSKALSIGKAAFGIFLFEYKLDPTKPKKITTVLLYKKAADAKAAMKQIKKEGRHKIQKTAIGEFTNKTATEWTFEKTGGGASIDLVSVAGAEIFADSKLTLKVQQGKLDPDMILDDEDTATPSSDVAPNEQADATKKTETPKADVAAKIKCSLDKYATSLDAFEKQITPANMKAIYDKVDMVKAKIVEFKQLLAQETAVDGELIKLLGTVNKKANDLQAKIDELEGSAKKDSDVTSASAEVRKVLQQFIAKKNAIAKAMEENPANPKIAAIFQKMQTEYVAAKTEIAKLVGTDKVAYGKALTILNAEKEKLDILEQAALEHKEDADDKAELEAELRAILKGKEPQQLYEEWDTQLKTLQADIQQLIKQAQGAK